MSIECEVDLTGGQGQVTLPQSAYTFWQANTASGKPIRLDRITLGTNMLGNTQQVISLQLITYASAVASGGRALTPVPTDHGLTATLATAFYGNTATIGGSPSIIWTLPWNGVNPLDFALPKDEFPRGAVLALTQAGAPGGSGFTWAGILYYTEL